MNGLATVPTPEWVERVLNRKCNADWPSAQRVLETGTQWVVTGGLGSLGVAITDVLSQIPGVGVLAIDIDEMDVTDPDRVAATLNELRPDVVLHLAGAKHAPEGELDPLECVNVNTLGTRNVLAAAADIGARVVTASTCKSCDPETAYGASKLLAERLTLNAGQRVARFHNVVETSGNVFEIWRDLAADDLLPVADCWRYFISCNEALALLLHAATAQGSGRWCVNPRRPQSMQHIATRLYPGRTVQPIERRGDRDREPLCASNEDLMAVPGASGLMRVFGTHDATPAKQKRTVAA